MATPTVAPMAYDAEYRLMTPVWKTPRSTDVSSHWVPNQNDVMTGSQSLLTSQRY